MNEAIVSQTADPPQAALNREAELRNALAASTVPEHIHEGLVEYLVNHHRPGSFLYAVLTNDLLMAVKRGDVECRANLIAIVLFLYEYAPIPSWGKADVVEAWLHGKEGAHGSR